MYSKHISVDLQTGFEQQINASTLLELIILEIFQ